MKVTTSDHRITFLFPETPFASPEHLSLPRNTFLFPETLFCYSNLSKFFVHPKKGIQQDSNPQPSAQQEIMLTTTPEGLNEILKKKSPSEFKREIEREGVCMIAGREHIR